VSTSSIRSVASWLAQPDGRIRVRGQAPILDDSFYGIYSLEPTDTNPYRPEVGAVYPAAGSNHGFDTDIPVDGPGTYRVCLDEFEAEQALTHMNLAITIPDDLGMCKNVTVPPF
jgi:hypothetical protein